MIYKEEVRDLFSVADEYCLAHCISADFGMGRGIAVEFNTRYDMKATLQRKYPGYLSAWQNSRASFDCIPEGRVFNLVTKERYFHKPTYASLAGAVSLMRDCAVKQGVEKIAMPLIGCGLDRLQWVKVSEIIQEIFADTGVEILVCKQYDKNTAP